MGVLKFQVTSPDISARLPDLRKAYFMGLDRIPMRMSVEYRQGMLSCHRESNESGKLFVPWPVPGQGAPIVGTATLAERREPYHLAVELARASSTTSETSLPTGDSRPPNHARVRPIDSRRPPLVQ